MLVFFSGNAGAGNNSGTNSEQNNARSEGANNKTNQNSVNTNENANAPNATGSATTTAANLADGDTLKLSGTVEKAPPANEAKQQWGLSDNGAQRLEQQGAYIQVAQVSKLEQRAQR